MPPDNDQYLLGQIVAKLDTLIQRSTEDRETIEKLTTRVQALEAWRWAVLGAASTAGGIGGLLTKVFTS